MHHSFNTKRFNWKIMADCISHLCTKCIRHFDCQLILSFSEKSCQMESIWLADTNSFGMSIYKHFCCLISISKLKLNTSFCIYLFQLHCSFITHGSGFIFKSCNAVDQIQLFCRNCFYEFWIGANLFCLPFYHLYQMISCHFLYQILQ